MDCCIVPREFGPVLDSVIVRHRQIMALIILRHFIRCCSVKVDEALTMVFKRILVAHTHIEASLELLLQPNEALCAVQTLHL